MKNGIWEHWSYNMRQWCTRLDEGLFTLIHLLAAFSVDAYLKPDPTPIVSAQSWYACALLMLMALGESHKRSKCLLLYSSKVIPSLTFTDILLSLKPFELSPAD